MPLPRYGTQLARLPMELDFTRVLEEFDGDILVEYRAKVGTRFYLEKWCASEGNVNRYLLVRSEPKTIAEYLANRVSMLDLLTIASDGFGFLVDRQGDQIVEVSIVLLSQLPPKYLPDLDAEHDVALRPSWSHSTINALLDGGWDANKLATIEKNCQSIFGFAYFTTPNTERKVPEVALYYEYEGGYPIARCFGRIREKMPKQKRVRSVSVSAASPGILSLETANDVFNHILPVLNSTLASKESYRRLYEWSKTSPKHASILDVETVTSAISDLCAKLNVSFDALFPAPTEENTNPKTNKMNILTAAKILASYYRRLLKLARKDDGFDILEISNQQQNYVAAVVEEIEDDGEDE